MSATPPPPPASSSSNRHATTAVDKQRAQLEKLLKDPSKPAYIPAAPKEKGVRPAREMMKNVQGSSAGAGSGEFHVYKASRRREYERLKLMDDEAQNETVTAEFERKKREWEEQAEAKTAKNRAKRQKKKERAKGKEGVERASGKPLESGQTDIPLKKRRLVNGQELVFKRPGEESDEGEDEHVERISNPGSTDETYAPSSLGVPVAQEQKIVIHEDE